MTETRDHGGGLDAAVAKFGGTLSDWLDLSTGINPVPYPVGDISQRAWEALPDTDAQDKLIAAARAFWNVPKSADIVAAPGASALIARMPDLAQAPDTYIPSPTYNEHRAAFQRGEGRVSDTEPVHGTHVLVHPNNPDGRLWPANAIAGKGLTVVDESFCDICPEQSHIGLTADPGVLVLKSFGKFWGLAGLRLGFAIANPCTMTGAAHLQDLIGPWAVSGPALEIGAMALSDTAWAEATRQRLALDATRLDDLVTRAGAKVVGGTDLFRLYDVGDAAARQEKLARGHVWSRIFPYSDRWLRLGLPAPDRWDQLEAAL